MAGLSIVPTPEVLAALGERLRSLNYTEEAAAAALDLPHLGMFFEQAHSLYRYSLLRAEPTLATLVRLFLVNDPVDTGEVIAALGKDLLIGLVRGGVMAVAEEGVVRCRYLLSPIDGAFIFTDRRFRAADDNIGRIMPLGHDTYNLVTQTQKRPGGTVLDLGTGSGVQGVLAARWASRVVSVDINPRALDFARMNAHLNGVFARMELHLGSLYDPVQGQRFDVILANPPFVPNPEYEVLFRDGGVQGEDIVHVILRDCPQHLEEGGILQMMTEIIYHDERGPVEKVREWSGDRLRGILFEQDDDFLRIYAEEHVLRAAGEQDTNTTLAERVRAYQQFLDSVGIWKITHMTLHLQPDSPPPDVPPETRTPVATADVANLRAVGAERVARGLTNVLRVAEPGWLARLADHRAVFDPDLRFVARWVPATGHALPSRAEFADGAPWRAAELEGWVFPLLRRLAECETLGDWVRQAPPLLDLPPAEAEPVLTNLLGDLVRSRWVSLVPPPT
ncbi:MAG: methyltransferase [Myxococcota bacterium]|jgi:methylase of polypeptide subunit release factors|nr:methyltransferase [Myxococcota bacterium]